MFSRKDVSVEGYAEVMARLRELEKKDARKIIRKAIRVGAGVIRKQVRMFVGTMEIPGEAKRRLRRSVRVKASKITGIRRGDVAAGITLIAMAKPKVIKKTGKTSYVDDPAVWWRWLEKGTEPRYRGMRNKGRGKAKILGMRAAGVRAGYTGGVRPQPVFEPAFDASAERALAAFTAKASALLDEWAKKKATGGGKK